MDSGLTTPCVNVVCWWHEGVRHHGWPARCDHVIAALVARDVFHECSTVPSSIGRHREQAPPLGDTFENAQPTILEA
jgi:hypothetical protein